MRHRRAGRLRHRQHGSATDSPWPYTPKAGASGTFPTASFFEGGLNLDVVFPNGAPCFSTFMAETRASSETTAQLKNFVTGSFDTCKPPTIETHVQQDGSNVSAINKGESVVDVATFSGGDGKVTGKADFFVCGPSQSKPDCSTRRHQGRRHQDDQRRVGHLRRVQAERSRLVLLPRPLHAGCRGPVPRRLAHQRHDRVLPGHPGRRPDRQDPE